MQRRQIVLDTETTGLYPLEGDRIIEIGCVEIIDGILTGNTYQQYLNPERDSHPMALRLHGLTTEFLADKPKFRQISAAFLDFIKGAELIIHNAPFDIRFLNHELHLIGEKEVTAYCPQIIDTKTLSEKLFSREALIKELISRHLIDDDKRYKALLAKGLSPTIIIKELAENAEYRPHSLDNLCKYYGVDLLKRQKNHGAIVDCELLAEVYFDLKTSESQQTLSKSSANPMTLFANKNTQEQNEHTGCFGKCVIM